MELKITNEKRPIKLNPRHIFEEIQQNIKMILLTFSGSCPLAREFALDSGIIDKPINVVQNLIYANLKNAIEVNETRVKLKKVSVEGDDENLGKLKITVLVEVKNEYI